MIRRRSPFLLALVVFVAALLLMPPHVAHAGTCSGGTLTQPLPDAGACLDVMQYNAYNMVAAQGWSVDRGLLIASFQLDSMRAWLISTAFLSIFMALVALVGPLLGPFAALAAIIACLLYLLLPLTGSIRVLDMRHIVTWALLGPAILTISGPLLAQVDDMRTSIGVTLFASAAQVGAIPVFGVAATDIQQPAPIYASAPCGLKLLQNGTLSGNVLPLLPADVAAAYLYADGIDIHCPQTRVTGGGAATPILLPNKYYKSAGSAGGQYAEDAGIDQEPVSSARRAAIERMQLGAQRAWEAIPLALFAALNSLINLVFSAALVAVWMSLPIVMLFLVFEPNAQGFATVYRGGLNVLKTSWLVSIALGVVFGCMVAAANLRNAPAVTGFSLLALVAGGYCLLLSGSALAQGLATLNTSATGALGMNPVEPARQLTGLAVGAAAASATGGASLVAGGAVFAGGAMQTALTADAAYSTTGSGTYAIGAVLGRIAPVARVGQIAAAMGLIDDDLADGLYTGERMAKTGVGHKARQFMNTDAQKKDDAGVTRREQSQEWRVNHQVEQALNGGGSMGAWRHGVVTGDGYQTTLDGDVPFIGRDPKTEALATLNIARLRGMGYQVRVNADGQTATYGKTASDDPYAVHDEPRTAQQTELDAAEERLKLIQRGGVAVPDRAAALKDAEQAVARAKTAKTAQDGNDAITHAARTQPEAISYEGEVVTEHGDWIDGKWVADADFSLDPEVAPIVTPPWVRGALAVSPPQRNAPAAPLSEPGPLVTPPQERTWLSSNDADDASPVDSMATVSAITVFDDGEVVRDEAAVVDALNRIERAVMAQGETARVEANETEHAVMVLGDRTRREEDETERAVQEQTVVTRREADETAQVLNETRSHEPATADGTAAVARVNTEAHGVPLNVAAQSGSAPTTPLPVVIAPLLPVEAPAHPPIAVMLPSSAPAPIEVRVTEAPGNASAQAAESSGASTTAPVSHHDESEETR